MDAEIGPAKFCRNRGKLRLVSLTNSPPVQPENKVKVRPRAENQGVPPRPPLHEIKNETGRGLFAKPPTPFMFFTITAFSGFGFHVLPTLENRNRTLYL